MYDHQQVEIAIEMLLRQIESVSSTENLRAGLRDTPKRVAKMYAEMTQGYHYNDQDIADLLGRTFEDDVLSSYDEMVIVDGIDFYSQCEHHLAPFFGHVHIGYIPQKKVVGLSKFPRLVEIFSRRLQVQERMTEQIAHAIDTYVQPKGVIVVVKGRHMCMESRGVRAHGAQTTTSAVRGAMFDSGAARMEFLSLIRKTCE